MRSALIVEESEFHIQIAMKIRVTENGERKIETKKEME